MAAEVIEREIVDSISQHSIGRFLREVDPKPHRVQGWINTPREDDFAARCGDVCETYERAQERVAEGIEVRIPDHRDRPFRLIVTGHSGRT